MPYRRGGFSRRRSMGPIVNSRKNVTGNPAIGVTSTIFTQTLAKAVDNPTLVTKNDVQFGCKIKALWLTFDVCGLGGTGVLNVMHCYIMKNPGANLTPPLPASEGSSNEKKFIFKSWQAMIMRNQDGNVPYHWEGWIKIPRIYQRMGADDTITWSVACTSAVTAHANIQAVYKYYT